MFRKANALMMISSNPLDFVENQCRSSQRNPSASVLLNSRVDVVTPEFLRAWASLREHIQKWELGYFFELTQPLINLEIVFLLVLAVLVVIGVLQNNYGGNLYPFLVHLISHSNVYMTMALFASVVAVTLFFHLVALRNVFNEQKVHEKWVSDMVRTFQIEEAHITNRVTMSADANKGKLSDYGSSLKTTRALLETMHSDMIINRAAPKFMCGVFTLNDAVIQSIMGTMITFLSALAYSYIAQINSSTQFDTDTTTTTPAPIS